MQTQISTGNVKETAHGNISGGLSEDKQHKYNKKYWLGLAVANLSKGTEIYKRFPSHFSYLGRLRQFKSLIIEC